MATAYRIAPAMVVAANLTGTIRDIDLAGESVVVDPWGIERSNAGTGVRTANAIREQVRRTTTAARTMVFGPVGAMGRADDDEAAKTEDEPDPVQELRADMEEAGLLEKSADDDSEEEVVRKGAKSGTSPDDVEKSSGSEDGKVSTSTEGITAAGRVN